MISFTILCSNVVHFIKNKSPAVAISAACIGIPLASVFITPKIIAIRSKKAFDAKMKELPRDVVHLFAFPRGNRIINLSSPCIKMEAFLRLHKIPYTISMSLNTVMSPSGRIPIIVYNGECYTDSNTIINFLKKQLNINENLSEIQEVQGLTITRLGEQTLAKGLYRSFVVDNYNGLLKMMTSEMGFDKYQPLNGCKCLDKYKSLIKSVFDLTGVAPLIMAKFAHMFRQKVIFNLNTEGYGDLSDEQYHNILQQDLEAVEKLIKINGTTFILGGSDPTSYDCGVFHIIEVFRYFGLQYAEEGSRCPPLEYLCKSVILEQYCDRVRSTLFPDLELICDEVSKGADHQEFLKY
eukprot:Tbor_TRINITY_DN5938_c2_g7::TRINITY_DN5938_c2_g7_i1::g.18834::m.18834